MFKFQPATFRFLRGKLSTLGGLAFAISSITCLTGCPQAPVPTQLPAGANGVLYLSPDHTQVVHLGGPAGSTRTNFDAWINADLESIAWVSKWDAQKPWCSMVGPRIDVDWEELEAKGTARPKSRLACIGNDGRMLPSTELPAFFTHAQVDPSGKSVVLFNQESFSESKHLAYVGRMPGPATLFNPNLVAVVDLEQGQVRTQTVEGFGAKIEGLTFPSQRSGDNQVEVGGQMRRLAAFWGRNELILLDLNDAELSQVAVSVRSGGSMEAPLLRLVPSGGGVAEPLLLAAGQSRDIDQIRLRPREGKSGALDADYSIITTVARVQDLELIEIDQEPWILSATPAGLSMINLKSSRERLIDGMDSLRQVRTFQDKSGKTMVVGVSDFGNSVFTIDPAKALTSLGRKPTVHRVGHSLRRVLFLENNRVAILGNQEITVVDLESGKKTPLAGLEETDSVTYSGGDYLYLFAYDHRVQEVAHLSLVRVQLSTMLSESKPLKEQLSGGRGFVKLNGGQGLGIPQLREGNEEFGIGYIDVNSPSLGDFSTTWFSLD